MNHSSISGIRNRIQEVLTGVGAFFVTRVYVSALDKNHCPYYQESLKRCSVRNQNMKSRTGEGILEKTVFFNLHPLSNI